MDNDMMMLPANAAEQINRVEIIEIVQRERIARDMLQWQELADSYNDDSSIDISWFKGTGKEFAAASEKMAARGTKTFHMMSPTSVRIKGNRAMASSGAAVHILGNVDGVDVDVISYARLYARAAKETSKWLLSGFRAVYIQDMMVPLDPSRAPQLDQSVVTKLRPSYRYLAYMLAKNGHPVGDHLAGMDRPETVKAMLDGEEAWLNG